MRLAVGTGFRGRLGRARTEVKATSNEVWMRWFDGGQ